LRLQPRHQFSCMFGEGGETFTSTASAPLLVSNVIARDSQAAASWLREEMSPRVWFAADEVGARSRTRTPVNADWTPSPYWPPRRLGPNRRLWFAGRGKAPAVPEMIAAKQLSARFPFCGLSRVGPCRSDNGHLRVFLARWTRVARIPISTPRMFKSYLIVGDSAVRLLTTLGARSAW
jgi:hypothetical protein